MTALDNWGEEAKKHLKLITGQHSTKKRHTLLALADAVLANQSQAQVFKNPACGSKVAHYKWLNDPVYLAAYRLLVGDDEKPGIARIKRQEEESEREAEALDTIVRVKRKLRLLSGDAVDELERLLSAESTITKDGQPIMIDGKPLTIPDHGTRLRAANSILNRIPETAGNTKHDITSDGKMLPDVIGVKLIDYRIGIAEIEE